MKVYLSMPLTNGGTNDSNTRFILKWEAIQIADLLKSWGYDVFIPHTSIPQEVEVEIVRQLGPEEASKALLKIVMAKLPECDTMIIAGNWERSVGCLTEMQAAMEMGMPIMEIPKDKYPIV